MRAYFDIEGRAGPIRAALHHAKILFTDNRIAFKDWPTLKETIPGKALPLLQINGVAYTQSTAIMRWAARQSELYPTDPVAALAVDEVIMIATEILDKCPQDSDVEVKKTKRQEYAAGKMNDLCCVLAAKATAFPEKFVCGESCTIADVCLYYFVMDMLRTGNFDYVAADYIDQWPQLTALESRIKAAPVIAEYEASKS